MIISNGVARFLYRTGSFSFRCLFMKIQFRRPKQQTNISAKQIVESYFGSIPEKYILLLKPGNRRNSVSVRVDADLESAIRNLAKKTGANPYLIRNAAIAIGLAAIEDRANDIVEFLKEIYRINGLS